MGYFEDHPRTTNLVLVALSFGVPAACGIAYLPRDPIRLADQHQATPLDMGAGFPPQLAITYASGPLPTS